MAEIREMLRQFLGERALPLFASFCAFRRRYAPDRFFANASQSGVERFLKVTTSSYQLCAEITLD